MSKAEKRACQYTGYCKNQSYSDFLNGYNQAEKDLGLTVEDVELICEIEFSLCYSENRLPTKEAFYQEVLKQFKERKEK